MKLLFKQRFFSWFDSYDVYDEQGDVRYIVKGQISWGHCLQIWDGDGNHVGTVKEKVLSFMPVFELYEGNSYIGSVKKKFTFFIPEFYLEYRNWEIGGDVMEWNYRMTDAAGRVAASAQKKIWSLTDTYEIDVKQPEDALYALMIVLAIDAAKCSQE